MMNGDFNLEFKVERFLYKKRDFDIGIIGSL